MNIIRFIENQYLGWKWVGISIFLFAYSFNIRFLNTNSLIYKNQWEFIFNLWSNPYLFLYFLTPLFIYYSCYIIIIHFRYEIILRCGSLLNWTIFTLKKILLFSFSFFSLFILITLFLIIGLPFESIWNIPESTVQLDNIIIKVLTASSFPPILIFLEQLFLIFAYYTFTHLIITYTFICRSSRSLLLLIAVILLIIPIISYTRLSLYSEFLNILNYLFIIPAYNQFGSTNFVVLFWCSLNFMVLLLIYWKGKRYSFWRILLQNVSFPFLFYYTLCFLGIIFFSENYAFSSNIWDNLYGIFYGVSDKGFLFINYIFYIIVFPGFSYLIYFKLNTYADNYNYWKWLRYGSLYKWFCHIFVKIQIYSIILLVSLFSIALLIIWIRYPYIQKTTEILSTNQILLLNYQFWVNGFLQLLNYSLILFVISWISKSHSSIAYSIAIISILGIPSINKLKIFPSALNSLGYLSTNINELLFTTFILLLYLLIESALIFWFFSKYKLSS